MCKPSVDLLEKLATKIAGYISMTTKRTYLDYNASVPLMSAAREAMVSALDVVANASSVHMDGRNNRGLVEKARSNVAKLVGADPANVVFTSGATEAAQLALSPLLQDKNSPVTLSNLYVSAIEHPCISNGGRFSDNDIETFPVTGQGIVDLALLKEMLANRNTKSPFLLALMLANNETGIIQPVQEVFAMVKNAGGYLLVDAVQAAGRIAIDMHELSADFLILSSHKLGGPQGAGALVCGRGNLKPSPIILGGSQENKLRAGTENVAAIAGFGVSAQIAVEQLEHMRKIAYIRNDFELKLSALSKNLDGRFGSLKIFGKDVDRIANTSCFAIRGINAETALISLDLDGISVSTGSACSSGRIEASQVLNAMGVDEEEARGAIRVSMGWDTTPEDTKRFLEAFASYLRRLA